MEKENWICSVVVMVTCTAGMRASEPVLHAWMKQGSVWRAFCSNNTLPAPQTSTELPVPCPWRKEIVKNESGILKPCLGTATVVCSSDASAHHSIFLCVFSPPQRQASPPHPPAWPTISVDSAPGVVEEGNCILACHFLLPGPSRKLLLLKSGDCPCLEPRSKGQGDSISDSPQRSWRNLYLGSRVWILRCGNTTATNAEGCFLRAAVIASFSHRFSYFREDVTIIQIAYSQGLNFH